VGEELLLRRTKGRVYVAKKERREQRFLLTRTGRRRGESICNKDRREVRCC
jgi:hypothetical protein